MEILNLGVKSRLDACWTSRNAPGRRGRRSGSYLVEVRAYDENRRKKSRIAAAARKERGIPNDSEIREGARH